MSPARPNLTEPTHDYTTTGVYTVSLTLSNTAGEVFNVTKEDFITVYSDLETDFVHSPTGSLIAPIRIDFTDISQNDPHTWAWDFGDGNTSTEQHPQHTYTTNGTFTVTLSVSNNFGVGGSSTGQAVKTDLIHISDVQSNATLHYVSPNGLSLYPYKSWEEAATNMIEAAAALEPGHTLLVTNGVYDAGATIFISTPNITIQSVNGPSVTIIEGGGIHSGISLSGTNCLIEGFTIRNSMGQQAALQIAGPDLGKRATGSIARNMIVHNSERLGMFGGLIYFSGGTLVDSLIYSNKCFSGAGIFANRRGRRAQRRRRHVQQSGC